VGDWSAKKSKGESDVPVSVRWYCSDKRRHGWTMGAAMPHLFGIVYLFSYWRSEMAMRTGIGRAGGLGQSIEN
jgi:hypothetical protein